MSQLLITTSWKSSSFGGTPPGACCTSNWLACSARMMCSSLAAGSCETSSTRGLRSVTESSKRASPRSWRRDFAGQRDGAHGVDAGLQRAGDSPRRPVPRRWSRSILPSAVSSTRGVGGARRFHRDIDGETLAAEYLPGNGDAFQPQSGLGTSGERHGIDGQSQLLRLPDGARHAAQILIAVGDQQQARHHARRAAPPRRRGSRASRSVPRPAASGGVAQMPAVLGLLFQRGGARAAGERHDARPMPAVRRAPLRWRSPIRAPDRPAKRWPTYPPARPPRPWSGRPSCADRSARARCRTKVAGLQPERQAPRRSRATPTRPSPAAEERQQYPGMIEAHVRQASWPSSFQHRRTETAGGLSRISSRTPVVSATRMGTVFERIMPRRKRP